MEETYRFCCTDERGVTYYLDEIGHVCEKVARPATLMEIITRPGTLNSASGTVTEYRQVSAADYHRVSEICRKQKEAKRREAEAEALRQRTRIPNERQAVAEADLGAMKAEHAIDKEMLQHRLELTRIASEIRALEVAEEERQERAAAKRAQIAAQPTGITAKAPEEPPEPLSAEQIEKMASKIYVGSTMSANSPPWFVVDEESLELRLEETEQKHGKLIRDEVELKVRKIIWERKKRT